MPVLWLIAATNTSAEILAGEEAGITVTLSKPMTSNSKAAGGHEGRADHQQHQHAPGGALAAPMRL